MDSSSTSNVENAERQIAECSETLGKIPSMEKLESMVTPEQLHSATVAKKRRTITRKRTNELNKARSQTPLRAQQPADETSTDDEVPEVRRKPKTTERATSTNVKTTNDQETSTKSEPDKNEKSAAIEKPTRGLEKVGELPADVPSEVSHVETTSNTEEIKKDALTGNVLKKRLPQKLAEVLPDEQESQERHDSNLSKVDESTQLSITPLEVEKIEEVIPDVVFRKLPKTLKRPDSGSASASDKQSINSEVGRTERATSLPRQLEEQIQKLDNFVTSNTQELKSLYQKAKSTVEEKSKELRRRKFKKTEDHKRSQSQPKELSQEEVMESFKRAQQATRQRQEDRMRSLSARRYSSGSDKSQSPAKPEPKRPARKRVLVQDIIKEEKKKIAEKKKTKLKDTVKCNKIVEVLDPMTSKVIEVKNIGEVTKMRFIDAFKIFRYYSLIQIIKEYRKYKIDMKEEYNIIRKLRRKCINHLLILFIFCGLGGIVFKYIEGAFENFYKCGVKRVKRDFIELLWVKSHNMREEEWKSLARNRLRIFEEELHTAHEAGIHSYSGQRSWSFLNGIVYCLTVVTTIGYGHLYPTTNTGQALTIVYALIGIPLFLIILTDFGKMFTRCIKFLWSFVRRLYYTGSCRKIRKTTQAQELFKGAQMMYEIATFRRPSAYDPNMMQTNQQPGSPQESTEGTTAPPTPAISNFEIDDEFNLPISVAILLLVLYIFLGAVLFGIWEGWDFFASFYFVFISMSTIGFGDYVPRHPFFMIVSIVYIVFGLALMSMCINVVQVKISDTFNQASAKIGATIGLDVAEDGTIKAIPPKPVEMPAVHGSIADINKLSPNTSANP